MSKAWTRKMAEPSNVELEVDLSEIFDGQLIPDSSNLRQAVGQEIIDIIRERTQSEEKSWTGSKFKNYSDEYANSIEFKAYGKSKNDPNLTQTGDMLGLMTVKEGKNPKKIVIGWDDSFQSEKAHGHITGHVGVKRDFLGLSSDDIEAIKLKFKDELPDQPPTENASDKFAAFLEGRQSIGKSSMDNIVDRFFANNDDEDGFG